MLDKWDDIWPAQFSHKATIGIYGVTFRGHALVIEYNYITPDGRSLCPENMLREISYEEVITSKHREYQKKYVAMKKKKGAQVTFDDIDQFISNQDEFLKLVKEVFRSTQKEFKSFIDKEEQAHRKELEEEKKGIDQPNT